MQVDPDAESLESASFLIGRSSAEVYVVPETALTSPRPRDKPQDVQENLPGRAIRRTGEVTMRWLQSVGVVLLVLVTAFLAWSKHPAPQGTEQPAQPAEALAEETSYHPLQLGDRWEYRSTVTNRRTAEVRHQRVVETVVRREGEGYRILQEVDGVQQDSRVMTPTTEGIRVLEYESARSPVLFLPPGDLTPGVTWEIAKNRRGVVESLAPMTVASREVEAVKIRTDRFFDRDETEDPEWLPQGVFWVARGLGVVKRDSSGSKRPRVTQGRVTGDAGSTLEIDTVL